LGAAGIREGLGWLRARLLGDERLLRPGSVMVRLTGEGAGRRWRELPAWPPPGTTEWPLWLGDEHSLRPDRPTHDTDGVADSAAVGAAAGAAVGAAPRRGDLYRYDPANPTPSVGGPVLLEREPVLDNRELEARADVLTYTTPPLPVAYEAIGPVRVELWISASEPFFDVFARVCDVDPDGASWNVCDALARVAPDRLEPGADGTWRVAFDLWPTGHVFAAAHRIRLQVSSGAHPRYARNPGSGEDPLMAMTLKPVDIEVLRDRDHPSALMLPCVGEPPLS
jgi:putative CocE/NonD family hydrolase